MTAFLMTTLVLFPAAAPTADLVVVNARIWTGDTNVPNAAALAVWNGRLLIVGTEAEAKATVGPNTKVIDAGGKRIVPGFYDSHAHVLGGGQQLARVELKDAKDEAEFGKRLVEFDKKTPSGRWMLGGNWDHDRAFKGVLPTAELLDKYVKDRPVFIRRYDGHMAVCNTAALKIAGITAETKDPSGGVISRKADGKTPAGVLKDNAMDLVDKHIPEPDSTEIGDAVRAALAAAAEVGVTSIQDMGGMEADTRRSYFRVLQKMAAANELTCRIDVRLPLAAYRELSNLGIEAGFGGEYLRLGGLKAFMDGSLGSSTAKMFEPYVSDATTTGVFVTQPEAMRALVIAADKAGLNVCVHAIGDRANAELLDIFTAATQANGPKDRRFRIEHVQHLRPQDYPRFKALTVVASMQPYHVADDGRWAEGRIGARRCESSYAFRSLLDAGAVLAFGSDWPVAPLDPLPGIDAAVNRTTLDGGHPNGWVPAQRITVAEAVRAYTHGSAYGGSQERERGTLTVGKQADFVVLDRDIFADDQKAQIGKTKVTMTAVGGKIIFERK
jgi:predicted amidohydrolase YtcJ